MGEGWSNYLGGIIVRSDPKMDIDYLADLNPSCHLVLFCGRNFGCGVDFEMEGRERILRADVASAQGGTIVRYRRLYPSSVLVCPGMSSAVT